MSLEFVVGSTVSPAPGGCACECVRFSLLKSELSQGRRATRAKEEGAPARNAHTWLKLLAASHLKQEGTSHAFDQDHSISPIATWQRHRHALRTVYLSCEVVNHQVLFPLTLLLQDHYRFIVEANPTSSESQF